MTTPEPPRRCRFFHKWEDIGLVPPATMVIECKKCGWQKTWNGFTTYHPPGSYPGANGVISHFYIREDGTVEQYQQYQKK